MSTSLADVGSGLSLTLRGLKNTGIDAKDRDFFKDPRLDSGAIGSDSSSVTATASGFLVISISVLESVLGFDAAGNGILEAETSAAILLSVDMAFDKTRRRTGREMRKFQVTEILEDVSTAKYVCYVPQTVC